MDNKSDLISLIIPVLNGEKYIEKSLESVFNQTYTNFEVIFAYDLKSKDRSIDIIEKYANLYGDRHRIVIDKDSDPNNGVGRNRGFALAKGKYVAFVDADDILHPQYIEYLHDIFVQNPDVEISACDSFLYMSSKPGNFEKAVKKADASSHKISIYSNKKFLYEFLHVCYLALQPDALIKSQSAWIYMVKRDFLLEHNIEFPSYFFAEDHEWIIKCLAFAKKVGFTSKVLYLYNIHDSSLLHTYHYENKWKDLKCLFRNTTSYVEMVDPELLDNFNYMIISTFFANTSVICSSYEEWSEFTTRALSEHPYPNNKMIMITNPPQTSEQIFVDLFNKDPKYFYVYSRMLFNSPLTDDELKIKEEIFTIINRDYKIDFSQLKEILSIIGTDEYSEAGEIK